MYLKSLEIFGFKSFAPKTVLNFDRGVTCVVGPNGCGKSNVLDSIRWVLGEQSAKALRGGDMTDVIFSGTDSRQKMGMAEVSMTFTECEEQLGLDWHEVKITRRVFREGGSEYLLNNTPCRLKDIHNLFMDTGIGRSAYSIMEQGKIDLILSSRPEDRRAIFEEAAGITKYKFQRKEALRKLEATEANMIRLADIIKEVKRQIGSVQRQAAKARRYQAMLEDLRTLETHHAKRQWDELDASRRSSQEDLDGLSAKQYEMELQVSAEEEQAHAQRAAMEEMEGRLNAARQGVQDLRQRITNHESRLVFNEERASEFASLTERYAADIAAAEEKFGAAETQLKAIESQVSQVSELLASELRRMEELQARAAGLSHDRENAERQVQHVSAEANRMESRLGGLRSQVGATMQQKEAAEARLAMLAGELSQLEFAFGQATERLGGIQSDLAGAVHSLEQSTAAVTAAEAAIRSEQERVAESDRALREAQRQLADRESRLEVLRSLIAGGEGLEKGTQAVINGLDNPDFFKPAIHGALVQCIDVPQEYIAAVEAVLGANLEAIVMKDAMIAESVVKTLTAKKLGKAALALRELESVFVHERNEAMQLPEGAIDWLINKITPQPEVRRLVERLINHTAVVPDIETALRLFPQLRGSSIVTLAGEVINGFGILHGGATNADASSSILARKNQIAALAEETVTLQASVDELAAHHEAAVAGVDAAQAALHDAREEKQNSTVLVSTLRNQLQLLEREQQEAEKKTQNLDTEKQNAEARLAEAHSRIAEQENEVHVAMEQFESLISRRAELQQQSESLRAQENEMSSELNDLKVKVATERERHTLLHHQRQPMEARIDELRQLIEERRNDIVSYEDRAAALQAENAELTENVERLRGGIAEAEQGLGALQAERSAMHAATEELNERLRVVRREQSQVVERRGAIEVRITQLELKANSIAEHIQKRYTIDLAEFTPDTQTLASCLREVGKRVRKVEMASDEEITAPAESADTISDEVETPAQEDEAIDWMRVESLVKELDGRLSGIGPVNLDAIAEYEELEQRHNFLEQQITDTENSKAELLDVIEKINKTTRVLFAETFEKIRVNFQEMFKELFGGGQANLIMTDESDPLECGIEIIAKPPGKQLQTISLLSGGERTMTAVSLLFSIYMVKPSPFCVLDEMDAPLDESNINRFIKILDRFVSQSQFVVISHNKRTIGRADALYGVTMEEHGVSKLVGVKFRHKSESQGSSDILGGENATPIPSVAESFGKSGNLHSEDTQAAGGAA